MTWLFTKAFFASMTLTAGLIVVTVVGWNAALKVKEALDDRGKR